MDRFESVSTGNFGGIRKVKTQVEQTLKTDISLVHKTAKMMGVSPEDALFFINIITENITDICIEQGSCRVRSLGIFKLQSVKNARYFKNERKDFITVAMRYMIRFRPSNTMKNRCNEKIKTNIKAVQDEARKEDAIRGLQ